MESVSFCLVLCRQSVLFWRCSIYHKRLNISMHVLLTFRHTFLMVLTWRISLTIKSIFNLWWFPFSRALNLWFSGNTVRRHRGSPLLAKFFQRKRSSQEQELWSRLKYVCVFVTVISFEVWLKENLDWEDLFRCPASRGSPVNEASRDFVLAQNNKTSAEFEWKFIKQNYFTLYYLTQQFDKKRVLTLL